MTVDRLLLLVAVLAVSTGALFVRGAGEAPPLVIAFVRLLLGTLLILPFARRARPERRAPSRRALLLSAVAGILLALHFATWIASLRLTSVASSIVLVTAHPVWVALGAWAFLGERVPKRVWGGIGIAAVGMVLLARVDAGAAPGSLTGNALAFAGGIAMAGYLLCGRAVRDQLPLGRYLAITYGTAALVVGVLVLAAGERVSPLGSRTLLSLLLLAVVPQGIGHTLLNRSLRAFGASTVSLATLGEVAGSTALAWMFLGEGVPPLRAAAVLVIVAAVAIGILPTGARWLRVIPSRPSPRTSDAP